MKPRESETRSGASAALAAGSSPKPRRTARGNVFRNVIFMANSFRNIRRNVDPVASGHLPPALRSPPGVGATGAPFGKRHVMVGASLLAPASFGDGGQDLQHLLVIAGIGAEKLDREVDEPLLGHPAAVFPESDLDRLTRRAQRRES